MAKIRIIKKCVFTDADGKKQVFEPGVHEVSDATAGHWFVKAHCAEDDPVQAAPEKPVAPKAPKAPAKPAAAPKAPAKAGKK